MEQSMTPWAVPTGTWTMPMMMPTMAPMMAASHLLWLLRALESAMPVAEVAHSLHAQASMDADVRNLPAMKRLLDAEQAHMQAKLATLGYIRRMLAGDWSQANMSGLQEKLGVMQRTHHDARTAFTQLMSLPESQQNMTLQSLGHVMGLANTAHQSIQPLVTPLVASEATTGEH